MSTTVTRYRVKPERVNEHQRLIEAVFAELEATGVDGFTFKVFRLDDEGTHVHVEITHDDVDDLANLHDTPSYRAFAAGWEDRCEETPARHGATIVGGWR